MEPYNTLLDSTGPNEIIQDHMGDHIGPYITLRQHMEPFGTKLDHTGPYGTIRDNTEPSEIIWVQTKQYKILPFHTGPYGTIQDLM